MCNFPTLAGKVAIVTGASRGIGAGIALELARRGARVRAWYLRLFRVRIIGEVMLTIYQVAVTYTSPSSEKAVDALIERIASFENGSDGLKLKADLRDPAAPKQIVDQTLQAFGNHIDILVNNAGVELVKPLQDISTDDFSLVYDLNAGLLINQFNSTSAPVELSCLCNRDETSRVELN